MSNVPNLERAVVEVFGGCNYKCQMCPQTTGRGKEWTRKMPFEMFENILDQLPGKPVINLEGSGEPTMAKDLPHYIEACTKRGLPSFMYSNGSFFSGHFMQDCINAGLSFARFSCIGYNKDKYKEWMAVDNFELLKTNVIKAKEYINQTNSKCEISSYHLILDNNQVEYEVDQYRNNWNKEDRCFDINGYKYTLPSISVENCLTDFLQYKTIEGDPEKWNKYNYDFIYFLGKRDFLTFDEIENLIQIFNYDLSEEESEKVVNIIKSFRKLQRYTLIDNGFEVDLSTRVNLGEVWN